MKNNVIVRTLSCRDGTTAILTGIVLTLLLWCGAFAVDIASLFLDRRKAQGAVDLAAIAAAQDITNAEQMARATLADNGIGNIQNLTVTLGQYVAESALQPSLRFTEGVEPYNAVRVNLRHRSRLYFAGAIIGVETFAISTQAVATTTAQAAFSIGSRLARLDDGLVNSVLGGLLGGNLQLTVMDYEALASANIKMFEFMDALASELEIDAGTYNDVLNAQANAGNVIDAMAEVTAQSGNSSASAALRRLGFQSHAASSPVSLNSLVDIGPYGNLDLNSSAPGFSPDLNVMQILSATAAIANGANQVSLDLSVNIPGLTEIKADLAIGEPAQHSAWFAMGETGSTVRTVQTRLRIELKLAPGIALPGTSVRIPMYIEVAHAEARLHDLQCGADPTNDAQAEIAARPGIAELWLGEISDQDLRDFSQRPTLHKARMVNLPLLRITGKAHAAITNKDETVLTFDWADADAGTVKRTHTQDYFASLFASLLHDLNLKVSALGGGLSLPGPIAGTIRSTLAGLSSPLDQLVSGLLGAAGVTLGEADVRLHGIRCDGSVLVG